MFFLNIIIYMTYQNVDSIDLIHEQFLPLLICYNLKGIGNGQVILIKTYLYFVHHTDRPSNAIIS